MLFNSNEVQTKKSNFWINIFSESDSKNQPLQQDLKENHKILLADIGDNLNQAIVPNIDSIAFENDKVFYKKTDTIVNNELFEIYVYSVNPDSAFYRLGFSFVGNNNGNYIPIKSSANGKVYAWVAPENGVLQGSYEPVILLISPKKKQPL